ncbi:hypothetical protein SUDANB126_06967 [Streptomyces sp. enrichment culture]
MKKQRRMPRALVTDKLRSYGAAHREVVPPVGHRSHKGLNNRAENSHQPTRQRARAMKGFRSVGGAQRFLSTSSGISSHFGPRRHLMTTTGHRAETAVRFTLWDQITGAVGQPAQAWTPARNLAPPRPDAPSDTHTPDNMAAPCGLLPGARATCCTVPAPVSSSRTAVGVCPLPASGSPAGTAALSSRRCIEGLPSWGRVTRRLLLPASGTRRPRYEWRRLSSRSAAGYRWPSASRARRRAAPASGPPATCTDSPGRNGSAAQWVTWSSLGPPGG